MANFSDLTGAASAQDQVVAPTSGLVARLLGGNWNGWTIALSILLICMSYDQIMYQWRKGPLPGPMFKIPFIGPFLESVNPKFSDYEAKWASGPLSCVSVFHKFVVISSATELTRKIFCSPLYAKPCLVDIAPTLLRPNNWVFLAGKAHTDFRKGLNGLFVRQSLEIYLPGQEEVYKKYFARWLAIFEANGMKPIPFMHEFREIMCATSCRTFVGHYLDDAAVKKIADDYYNITAALELVNFPFVVPFTRAWRGKKAADMVIHAFELCATKAKVRMRQGAEVTCIMDAWIKQMLESEAWREAEAAGKPLDLSTKPAQLLRLFSDTDISLTLMTFLFASQDATSSATTWMFQLMADRPEHLEKIRAEQLAVRGGDKDKPLTMDMMEAMTYTRAVVKETLRYRPPVSMVPYETKIDFPITESYTVPKGSMVIPTVHTALQDPEAYPNPSSFDPERWITGDADAQVKNWLVFGAGPHYCIGQVYATYNLMALIGNASLALDWRHEVTDLSEEIKVFATIFPMDDCLLSFGKR